MVPQMLPGRRRDGLLGQPLSQSAQRYLFLRVAPEQLPLFYVNNAPEISAGKLPPIKLGVRAIDDLHVSDRPTGTDHILPATNPEMPPRGGAPPCHRSVQDLGRRVLLDRTHPLCVEYG